MASYSTKSLSGLTSPEGNNSQSTTTRLSQPTQLMNYRVSMFFINSIVTTHNELIPIIAEGLHSFYSHPSPDQSMNRY